MHFQLPDIINIDTQHLDALTCIRKKLINYVYFSRQKY